MSTVCASLAITNMLYYSLVNFIPKTFITELSVLLDSSDCSYQSIPEGFKTDVCPWSKLYHPQTHTKKENVNQNGCCVMGMDWYLVKRLIFHSYCSDLLDCLERDWVGVQWGVVKSIRICIYVDFDLPWKWEIGIFNLHVRLFLAS